MKITHQITTRPKRLHFTPRMNAAAVLGTTLLFGSLLLPEMAEAQAENITVTRGRKAITQVELTAQGKSLEAKYAQELETLQAKIREVVPTLTNEQHEALNKHLSDLVAAEQAINQSNRDLSRLMDYEKAVKNFKSAESVIEDAETALADRQAFLTYARALPDNHPHKEFIVTETERVLKLRQRDLERAPKTLEDAKNALAKATENKDKLAAEKKKLQDALQESKAALAKLRTDGMQHLATARLADVLSSQQLDTTLAKFMVLNEGRPYWLAAYAQQGPEYEQRIERLLGNTPLMLRMLIADGAIFGQYGKAMEIYEKIQQTSPRAKEEGVFERLALAVGLEHAVAIAAGIAGQDAHGGPWDENTVWIDPVERYLEYEKAWLDGELDPNFDKHDVWSLRMVVNVYQTGEFLSWGREMLRNYRPDLVSYPLESLRYSKAVDEEISYTAIFQKLGYDRDELERMQNILSNGGICGRRAHFGGYILSAFGVPTTERPQRGHAALVRYTPSGWVAYLGAGWSGGHREMRGYRSDSDFRVSTEARKEPNTFLMAKRAQWIGKAMGEEHRFGWGYQNGQRWKRNPEQATPPEPWNAVSSIMQEGIVQRVNSQTLDAIAEELGESDESYDSGITNVVDIPASERQISVDGAGVIHIPAAATSRPTNNTKNILFMPSNQGGFQLHFRRYGTPRDSFEYTVEATKAGTYALSSKLVTSAWDQYLDLSINGADQPINIELPYTKGLWGELEPVHVELKQGTNVLKFSRMHFFMNGISIRDFKLVPVVN